MTNEEAKAVLNIYAGITMMSALKDPENESMANMSQRTIDMVSDRLELEHKDDGKGD